MPQRFDETWFFAAREPIGGRFGRARQVFFRPSWSELIGGALTITHRLAKIFCGRDSGAAIPSSLRALLHTGANITDI